MLPYPKIYKARTVKGELPTEDEYLREIGKAIAQWDKELRSQENFNVYACAMEYKVSNLLRAGNTKDAFLASVRKEMLKEKKQ